jgi:hypothetical protein
MHMRARNARSIEAVVSEIIDVPGGPLAMAARSLNPMNWPGLASVERRRLVIWLVVSVFAALLAYFGFRGYLSPELLFQFGNSLHC